MHVNKKEKKDLENIEQFLDQGCQMVCFKTKNINLVHFTAVWCTYFLVIWYIFPFWNVWTKTNLANLFWTNFILVSCRKV
jgi:hypothetical protein